MRPLVLLAQAFCTVLVHRLTIYAPRSLPTLGRPHAVALHFARRDQLAAGLAPAGVRPCWAHVTEGMVTMPKDEFEELLERVAGRGVHHALADVGLDGEDAASDIRELRGMLEAFNMAKHTA